MVMWVKESDSPLFWELLFCLGKFMQMMQGVGGRLNYSLVKTQTAGYHLFLQGEPATTVTLCKATIPVVKYFGILG